jgi:beta-lactamase superfamily II metal-dependent hydrolase
MRRTLGVVFQDFRLIDKKTVWQNLEFVMRSVGASPRGMKKRILTLILAAILIISLCACSKSNNTATKIDKNSTFSIHFIDVGQGDAALVECDGHYMLIDGGDTTSANDVYDTLVAKGVQHLDILAVSHLHKDHIGGLPKVLTYTTKIDLTLCNADEKNTEIFRSFAVVKALCLDIISAVSSGEANSVLLA